ncbi:MAG: 4Fe-4S dicluster domain-containing protein [Thermoanaerobaculales bacterium]|nr:4Fe-4S dicluster domain-containing protein [Thermoanaerobaculales bacterium]
MDPDDDPPGARRREADAMSRTIEPEGMTRRKFLTTTAATGCAVAVGSGVLLADGRFVIPNSEGFLVVDMKKCQACGTCMMACALAHTGVSSYSLSRIQVLQDSFVDWPDDVVLAQCRQCQNAPCVEVCPTGANHVDREHGNVRRVDRELCIGCKMCIQSCPFTPARLQWDTGRRKSQKCDLCVDTPYLDEKGGPDGVQACVRVCPVNAIAFTRDMPAQTRDPASYSANLRDWVWKRLGMTTE